MSYNDTTYKRLGDYIREVDVRNSDLSVSKLVGLTIAKAFIPSVANTIGTDLSKYKIIRENQFACSLMQVSRDGKMPIAIYKGENAIMSPAYPVFEVYKEGLLPDYLQMWFSRPEFDREAVFYAVGGVRGSLDWNDFMDMMLPVPPLEEQQRIVDRYNAIQHRIATNKQTIAKLEEAAQALYRKMFVDNIDPENLPAGWRMGTLGEVCSKIGSGSTPKGGKDSYLSKGISLIRSMNVFDYFFEREELAHITVSQAKALNSVTVQEQDILLNITGASVGRCCMVSSDILPARVNQHVMIIRAKESIYQYFLLYQINSKNKKKELLSASESGSTREALTKGEIEMQKILIPSRNNVISFDDKIRKICDSISLKSKESGKLTELLLMVILEIK